MRNVGIQLHLPLYNDELKILSLHDFSLVCLPNGFDKVSTTPGERIKFGMPNIYLETLQITWGGVQ